MLMRFRLWSRLGSNPWSNGLRLAALNVVLAVFCIASFLGTLALLALLPGATPFPVPLLLLLDAVLFAAAWVRFAQRLSGCRRERLRTALIGALPLFALSLLGYVSVMGMLALGDFAANAMLDASVAIFTVFATLILLTALLCVVLIVWPGRRPAAKP